MKRVLQRWPWISLLIGVAFFLSPQGQDLVRQSFSSGAALARSLGQLVLYIVIAIVFAAMLLEWLFRWLWFRRRRP